MRGRFVVCAAAVAAAVALGSAGADAAAPQAIAGKFTVGHAHVLGVRGFQARMFAVQGSGNLTYHGGPVMKGPTKSIAIFWEPSTLQSGAAGIVSGAFNSTIQRYFKDVGGHGLYGNNTQYSSIKNSSKLSKTFVDTSAYPATACPSVFATATQHKNCLTDGQIQAEVSKAMTALGTTGGLNELYFVFLDKAEYTCIDASACYLYPLDSHGKPQGYCAYHSNFTVATKPVLYADMPYGDTPFSSSAGSASSLCTGLSAFPNDRSADIEIGITSHEQMEAVTDPLGNAWFDSVGFEIGDKCAYDYTGSTLDGGLADEQWVSHFYSMQTEYSNSTASCIAGGSFTPSSRTPVHGTTITLTGSNFTASSTIAIKFKDHAGTVTSLGNTTSTAAGKITKTITIPAGSALGKASIITSGPNAGDGSTEFVTVS